MIFITGACLGCGAADADVAIIVVGERVIGSACARCSVAVYRNDEAKRCQMCGAHMIGTRSDAVYCSGRCRIRALRDRRRGGENGRKTA